MTKLAFFLFIVAGILVILAVTELYRAKVKVGRVEEILTERDEEFTRERQTLDKVRDELKAEAERLKMDTSTPIRATYFTSESDLMKYSDDKKLIKAVKKSLCFRLADELTKIAEPRKVRLDDGRDMYLLEFRVKEEGK